MRIHHVNCGTMCPNSAWFVTGEGGLFSRARMVCHVLVVETRGGLVLVDTGIGHRDVTDPSRLGGRFVRRNHPALDVNETAMARVQQLGFDVRDVRHIVPTHLDLDHAGGLPDFPEAEVHVFRDELGAAMAPAGPDKKIGYQPLQWAHGPRWVPYAVDGEKWFGFSSVRVIPGLEAEIRLVPLVGHSIGHCGVAVRDGDRWLLHAGDAYFSHHEIAVEKPRSPWGVALFQRIRSTDNRARIANQERLRELVRNHASEVKVFSAHSAVELDQYGLSPS